MIQSPFDKLIGQPLVAQFLSSVIAQRLIHHAYLFVGPIGAGKHEAARALAQALICREDGCGVCDECRRVARGSHPDVKLIEPEGAHGYLTEQIHDLIRDVNLAPIRAQRKVYLISRADLLQGAPANAFLKTLEEPPSRVVFVLLARTRDSVLETVASRCQIIAFRSISEEEGVRILLEGGKTTLRDARIAWAAAGCSLYRAREFLGSTARRETRVKALEAVERLAESDPLDVLTAARELLIYLKQPLDEVRLQQERQLTEGQEYLSKGALTALEQKQKRAMTNREREALGEACQVMRSWLRDCLLVRIGSEDALVNVDFRPGIQQAAAQCDEAALVRAVGAVDEAEERMHYNVSLQSIMEALFLRLRDELRGTG